MKPIIINDKRAQLIVSKLQDAFKKREGILAEVDDLVENQIPQGAEPLSEEHASFLFFIVNNDHGMKSSRLYERAKELFIKQKKLFKPVEVLKSYSGPEDSKLVEHTGNFLGTRYPRGTAKNWFINSTILMDKFSGKTINLFRSHNKAELLLREIVAFRGYGPKTGGMLLRAIIGLKFMSVSGIENVLVPVDIHDSRISFYTGIMSLDNNTNIDKIDYYSFSPYVQQTLLDACNHSGISWLDVDRALWLIGSRGCVKKRCSICPLQEFCSKGDKITSQLYINY